LRALPVAALFLLALPSSAIAQGPDASSLQAEHAQRRATFAAGLPDGIAVVLGAREPEREYVRFFQSPSFRYLTGIEEPNSALVIVKEGDSVRTTLFVPPRNAAREAWTGSRLGTERATRITGLPTRDEAGLIPALDTLLRAGARLMVVTDPAEVAGAPWLAPLEAQFVDTLRALVPALRVDDVTPRLQRQRAVKSSSELASIRRAADLTVRAHREAARAMEPGMNEFEIQALIEYTFRRNGADRPAFASIVGSGPNATTLHYTAADRFMEAGETVVVDIGASYAGYSADVTRTYPVGGTFSPAQREIYAIVREAQAAAERQVRPGGSARAMMDSSDAVLAAGLARLGLIAAADATYECAAGRRCRQAQLFTIHGLSHGIGLEVHDPEAWYFTGVIAEGSAFTLEPGLYIRANLLEDVVPDTPANAAWRSRLAAVLPRYAGIGVRIEDDYVVTERGAEWISQAPRELEEVEALMREPFGGPAPRDPALVDAYRRGVP
jgi:Xaa-Pro aminopeptidase